jgi:hypothetical protein
VAGAVRTSCLFRVIHELSVGLVIPPRIYAAFWQILAEEPILRSLGRVVDRAGRPGVGISVIYRDRPEFRKVLIVSPTTGELLGSEDVLIGKAEGLNLEAPTLLSFIAILESKYTTARGPSD